MPWWPRCSSPTRRPPPACTSRTLRNLSCARVRPVAACMPDASRTPMAFLKRLARQLANGYRFHHESNPWLLAWFGVVGVVAFSTFYLVRLTGKLPPRWDDSWFRALAMLSCLVVALGRFWPRGLARFYLPYSYATIFYCLAFFMPLTLLQNGGAPNTVMNMM